MSIFGNMDLNVDRGTVSEGFTKTILSTGAYAATVITATVINSAKSAAKGVRVTFDIEGVFITETYWFSNKEGKSTYTNKEGKAVLLSGARFLDDLSLVATGKRLNEQTTDERYVDAYENGKKVPKMATVLTSLLGTEVIALVRKIRRNAREQVNGEWVDTNNETFVNEVFSTVSKTSKKSGAEILTNEEPTFFGKWVANNPETKVVDQYEVKAGLPTGSNTSNNDLPF